MSSVLTPFLSKPTFFFKLPLWSLIIICFLLLIILILFLYISFTAWCSRNHRRRTIDLMRRASRKTTTNYDSSSINKRLLSRNDWDFEMNTLNSDRWLNHDLESASESCRAPAEIIRVGKEYTWQEIEAATNGLAYDNVIGCGDYGVVYHGVLFDKTQVAVKKLVCNFSGEDEEFREEVEALWCIRHKNLVKLLGYCIAGNNRVLVYEYIENDSLRNWLHGFIGQVSPLTWNMRLKIIIGIAKGLSYLHEGTEPPLVHQRIKSSNILLGTQWNPKISDFATNRLFALGNSRNRMSSVKGMEGYLDPVCSSGNCNEKIDVYSFGILIMEIISGNTPVGCFGTDIEEYLIDWIKSIIKNRCYDQVVDPKMPELPSLKELKRVLLIALRCVDDDVENRPKIGDVIHMLEPRNLLFTHEAVTRDNYAFLHENVVA